MTLLFDGDMLVYRFCAACQEVNPFDKSIVEKACPYETWNTIEMRINQCHDIAYDFMLDNELQGGASSVNIVLCFSSERNFRKEVNPEYKANRTQPKPVLYHEMVEKCRRLYDTETWDGLEADDVLGILSDEYSVIVSGDKDLLQIEGYHLNLIDPEDGIHYVDEKSADFLFKVQCLSGDSTDGYYGCPGIGKKKAEAIIGNAFSNWWPNVVTTYENAMTPKTKTVKTEGGKKRTIKLKSVNRGLGEKDALMTARMAYILRHDYEYKDGEVKLWQPCSY